jgi:hypothetical protein
VQNLGEEAGFLRERALRPAYVNGQVLPFGPAALLERFVKGAKVHRERRHRSNHGYARNPISLLRPRGERQRSGRATKNLDEIASSHCLPPKAWDHADLRWDYSRNLRPTELLRGSKNPRLPMSRLSNRSWLMKSLRRVQILSILPTSITRFHLAISSLT